MLARVAFIGVLGAERVVSFDELGRPVVVPFCEKLESERLGERYKERRCRRRVEPSVYGIGRRLNMKSENATIDMYLSVSPPVSGAELSDPLVGHSRHSAN